MPRTALVLLCLTLPVVALAGDDRAARRKKEAEELATRQAEAAAKLRYFDAPPLTPQKAAYIHQVIGLTVLDDLGKLPPGLDRRTVRANFYALEVDALPFLIRWMDEAANKYGTCPCTMLGQKLGRYVNSGTGLNDFDTIGFVHENLGKNLIAKDPPQAYKDLRLSTTRAFERKRREKETALKAMKFPEVLALAKTIASDPKARKQAEWRVLIDFIGNQKSEPEAFDVLLTTLEKATTPDQRKTARDALVQWSGVNHGPKTLDSPGETVAAVARWKEWHSARPKVIVAPKQPQR